MKRTIALLLTLILALGAFTACGGPKADGTVGSSRVKFTDVYKPLSESSDGGYLSVETLPARSYSTQGGFLRYTENGAYLFFSVAENRTILSVDTSLIASPTDLFADGSYIFAIETNAGGEETTKVYNELGALLASETGRLTCSFETDGFILGESFYAVKDGAVTKRYPIPPFLSLSDVTFTDSYAVMIKSREAVFYNDAFEPVAVYSLPATAKNATMTLLEGNKLFVQYRMLLDPAAKNFDIYADEKYELHQEIFDPAKEKTTDLDLGIEVVSISNRESSDRFDSTYTEKVKNIVKYRAIVNGIVDTVTEHYVLMDENGKLGASLDGFVEGQKGLIRRLNGSYYYVETQSGYAILNAQGEVVKSTPAIGTAKAYGYFYNNKVYNADFTPALDLSGAGNIVSSSYAYLLYSKAANGVMHYYRYDKTGEHELTPPQDLVFYSAPQSSNVTGCYSAIYKRPSDYSANRICLYNREGELLITARYDYSTSFSVILTAGGACIVRYADLDGNTVYARLAK